MASAALFPTLYYASTFWSASLDQNKKYIKLGIASTHMTEQPLFFVITFVCVCACVRPRGHSYMCLIWWRKSRGLWNCPPNVLDRDHYHDGKCGKNRKLADGPKKCRTIFYEKKDVCHLQYCLLLGDSWQVHWPSNLVYLADCTFSEAGKICAVSCFPADDLVPAGNPGTDPVTFTYTDVHFQLWLSFLYIHHI